MKDKIVVAILEDDSLFAELISRWLLKSTDSNFDIHIKDSIGGLEKSTSLIDIDVVIADLTVKNGSGLGTITAIKEFCNAPIIILTGSERTSERHELLLAHSRYVLYKDEVQKDTSRLQEVVKYTYIEHKLFLTEKDLQELKSEVANLFNSTLKSKLKGFLKFVWNFLKILASVVVK